MGIKLYRQQEAGNRAIRVPLSLVALLIAVLFVAAGCSSAGGGAGGSTSSGGSSTTGDGGAAVSTTANTDGSGPQSGEVSGTVGQTIQVAKQR